MNSLATPEQFAFLVGGAIGACAVFVLVLLALLVRDWRRGELW